MFRLFKRQRWPRLRVMFTSGPSFAEIVGSYQASRSTMHALDEAEIVPCSTRTALLSSHTFLRIPRAPAIRCGSHSNAILNVRGTQDFAGTLSLREIVEETMIASFAKASVVAALFFAVTAAPAKPPIARGGGIQERLLELSAAGLAGNALSHAAQAERLPARLSAALPGT
jgi:hypothetical protein